MLKTGQSFDQIIELIPDELYDWLKNVKETLENEYQLLLDKSKLAYNNVKDLSPRKEQAIILMKEYKNVASIVFKMLDNGDPDQLIWNQLKPDKFVQPFANKGEE